MKKTIIFVFVAAIICICFYSVINFISPENNFKPEVIVTAKDIDNEIILQLNNPIMLINGNKVKIDSNSNVTPVVVNNRTLIPVRALIENIGGSVNWNSGTQTVTLNYKNDEIRLIINNTTAYLNNKEQKLDSEPVIINGHTMLPIRFITENFGFDVNWNKEDNTIMITNKKSAVNSIKADENLQTPTDNSTPVVYMTKDISSESLMNIYKQLNFNPQGNVAVKLSTGEAGNTHYLDPNLIKDLVQSVDGTIVECNTAYGGSRASTAMHRQVAQDHGFTSIADVDIMDADGSVEIPVSSEAKNIKYDIVGKNFENYDSMLVLSHFKGHAMGGFGGAIKNISIGIASSTGKVYIHSGGHSQTSWSGGTQDQFLESMAEAAQAVHNNKLENGGIVYISVMNNLSVDCDCDGNPAEPEMNDVGILASHDPVALDQACVDIVYDTDRKESRALIERIESRNGIHTLEHAEKIGLGKREYNLVNIDN